VALRASRQPHMGGVRRGEPGRTRQLANGWLNVENM